MSVIRNDEKELKTGKLRSIFNQAKRLLDEEPFYPGKYVNERRSSMKRPADPSCWCRRSSWKGLMLTCWLQSDEIKHA